MNAEIFSRYGDLLKLKDRWDGLYSRVGGDNMFLTWEWHEALCRAFHRHDSLTIVSFEDQGEFVGIAPLIRKEEVVYFLSNPLFAGFMDFLILRDHEAVLDSLLDVLGPGATLRLRRVRQDSPTIAALDAVLQRRGAKWHRRVEGLNLYVPAQEDFHRFLSGRPKPLVKEVHAAEKALDSAGDWTFVRERTGPQAKKILERLFELDRDRRPSEPAGHTLIGKPDDRTFFHDLLAHYHRHLGMDLSAICQGDRLLSCALGLCQGGRYTHWLMASERGPRRTNLGKLHMARLMEDAFKGGCKSFDFMLGDEGYALEWADVWQESYEYRVFPGAAEMYIHKARCKAEEALRAVKRRAIPSWRRIHKAGLKHRRKPARAAGADPAVQEGS